MQVPCQDPLVDRLVVSVLAAGNATTATTVTGATKTPASMPQSCAALLSLGTQPASTATLDVKIQGKNKTGDAWTDVVVFVQQTNLTPLVTRANLPVCYKMYQAIVVSAGTSIAIPYTVALVGTDVMNAPIVQS